MQYFKAGLRAAQDHGLLAAVAMTITLAAAATASAAEPGDMVQRGRYLAQVAGCNDCHTPGYMETAGAVDEKLWLTGDSVGWHGPWGTTYPPNLRLVAQLLTEDQWVIHARAPRRPPMPWYALRDMEDQDVRALYQYLRFMGPAGEPAPAALAPGVEPPEPVFRAPSPPPPAQGG
jgi:mono/diheme cytochrome c family protein